MAITSPIRIDCKVFRGCCLMKEVMDWWSSLQILNKRGQLLLLSSEQFKLTSFLYFPLLCLPMSTTLLIGAVIWIQKNCENDLIAIRRCINVTKVSNFSFEIMLKSIEDYNLVLLLFESWFKDVSNNLVNTIFIRYEMNNSIQILRILFQLSLISEINVDYSESFMLFLSNIPE